TNCSSCHNNSTATGMKTPPHIPTGALQCSNCHQNTTPSFRAASNNTTDNSASRSEDRNNVSYDNRGAKGAHGTEPRHVATSGGAVFLSDSRGGPGLVSGRGA